MNVCSYHLQEAGATPVQEIAYSLATAIGVLDAVRESGQVDDGPRSRRWSRRSRSSSTPASASSRRPARCGPSPRCGTASASSATASPTRRPRRFRYGVQVNSLGLTEAQPENNVQRIVLEMLGVTLSKRRPRPVDPAAGVERGARPAPAVGPAVVAAHPAGAGATRPTCSSTTTSSTGRRSSRRKTAELVEAAQAELDDVLDARRRVRGDRRAEGPAGAQPRRARCGASRPATCTVVGVNAFTETRRRRSAARRSILRVDPAVEAETDRRRADVALEPRQRRREAQRSTSCAGSPSRART